MIIFLNILSTAFCSSFAGLAHASEPSRDEWLRVGKSVAEAFQNIGFVYLKNHGVPETQVRFGVSGG